MKLLEIVDGYDGYQRALASMVYKVLIKNRIGSECVWATN